MQSYYMSDDCIHIATIFVLRKRRIKFYLMMHYFLLHSLCCAVVPSGTGIFEEPQEIAQTSCP